MPEKSDVAAPPPAPPVAPAAPAPPMLTVKDAPDASGSASVKDAPAPPVAGVPGPPPPPPPVTVSVAVHVSGALTEYTVASVSTAFATSVERSTDVTVMSVVVAGGVAVGVADGVLVAETVPVHEGEGVIGVAGGDTLLEGDAPRVGDAVGVAV